MSAGVVGVWAEFFPTGFYSSFPLPGHPWVSPLGAYDEHLVRDVGGLYLSLLTVSVWAVARPRAETFVMVGAGWEVFSVPHLLFHLRHLDMLDGSSQVGTAMTLGVTVLLAAALLVPTRRGRDGDGDVGARFTLRRADGGGL